MTRLTNVLLLSVVALITSAPNLAAKEITIHGASWGQSKSAPQPAAAASPPQRWQPSDKKYKNPGFRYGQRIRYSRQAGRNRPSTAPASRRYGGGRINYGNRIRYGHGKGYGLSK